MDLNTAFTDYWEILNNWEDHIKGGYRSEHTPAPSFEFVRPGTTEDSADPAAGDNRVAQPAADGPLEERISLCRNCDLHMARKAPIIGQGCEYPRLMAVLPPPGYDEDDLSEPLTGEPRDFFMKWMAALGLDEEQIYLTNTVKCRTPGTRPPLPGELVSCRPFLEEQIEMIKPRSLLLLGDTALSLLGERESDRFEEIRGKPLSYRGIFTVATYDPLQVLRHLESLKRPAWEDLKIIRDFLAHE